MNDKLKCPACGRDQYKRKEEVRRASLENTDIHFEFIEIWYECLICKMEIDWLRETDLNYELAEKIAKEIYLS